MPHEISQTYGIIGADDETSSYALACGALARVQAARTGVISHASVHGLSGADRRGAPPPPHVAELRDVMLGLVEAGWELRRLATVNNEDDLDHEIALAGRLASLGRTRIHATIGAAGGHAAIIVEGRFVLAGLDDPHTCHISRSLLIEDTTAVSFWSQQFAQVFDDRRSALVISGPAGLDHAGIAELRRRARGYDRLMSTAPGPSALTEWQRAIAELLACEPRPQLATVARELSISREAVKSHCERLYELFAIPRGRDRLGPLVTEMRRRGVV